MSGHFVAEKHLLLVKMLGQFTSSNLCSFSEMSGQFADGKPGTKFLLLIRSQDIFPGGARTLTQVFSCAHTSPDHEHAFFLSQHQTERRANRNVKLQHITCGGSTYLWFAEKHTSRHSPRRLSALRHACLLVARRRRLCVDPASTLVATFIYRRPFRRLPSLPICRVTKHKCNTVSLTKFSSEFLLSLFVSSKIYSAAIPPGERGEADIGVNRSSEHKHSSTRC